MFLLYVQYIQLFDIFSPLSTNRLDYVHQIEELPHVGIGLTSSRTQIAQDKMVETKVMFSVGATYGYSYYTSKLFFYQ